MANWRSALQPGDRIIAAVSGGADSIMMLETVRREAPPNGWEIHVVHINHHLRGEISDAHEEFVRLFAGQRNLPFHRMDVRDEELCASKETSTSLEARLREERFRLLRAKAKEIGARAIALGHTASDAAETFLIMALRGAGPRGLGSMKAVRHLRTDGLVIVRPVFDMTKAEIEDALRGAGQPWCSDPMNDEPVVRRNRLRHQVLPHLRHIEAGAERVLARSAELCGEESELLETLAAEHAEAALLHTGQEWRVFDATVLGGLSAAMRRVVVRHLWVECARSIGEERIALPPSKTVVDDLAEALGKPGGGERVFQPHSGVAVVLEHRLLQFRDERLEAGEAWTRSFHAMSKALVLPSGEAVVPVLNSSQRFTPGRYEVRLAEGGGRLDIQVCRGGEIPPDWIAHSPGPERRAVLDTRPLMRDLVLRALDKDDRLLAGKGIHKSGGDVLREAGIPLAIRSRIAVLADDRDTFWIPGVRRSSSARPGGRTEFAILIEWLSE